MAEPIDNLSPLRARIYPWDEWTDGRAWRIRRGEDFKVSAASMATMVRLRAKADGMTATCRIVDDGEAVEFQFSDPEREAA